MHICSLSALILTATTISITLAAPTMEPLVRPRNHVECDTTGQSCKVQQTCANDASIVAGTVPNPWPAGVSKTVNLVPALESSASRVGAATSSRKLRDRQQNAVTWCALGTPIYILLAVQGTQAADAIQSTLSSASQAVTAEAMLQATNSSETSIDGIAAGSAPVYNLTGAGTTVTITAYNAAGVNMTWLELQIGLLTTQDWMQRNGFGWGSASVWNATDEVGLIYITV